MSCSIHRHIIGHFRDETFQAITSIHLDWYRQLKSPLRYYPGSWCKWQHISHSHSTLWLQRDSAHPVTMLRKRMTG